MTGKKSTKEGNKTFSTGKNDYVHLSTVTFS